jgi:hypothetical protein
MSTGSVIKPTDTIFDPASPTEIGGTAPDRGNFTDVIVNGPATADVSLGTARTGTAEFLTLPDTNATIRFTNAALTTVTIPSNAAVPFRIGTQITLVSEGGSLVVQINTDTLNSRDGLTALAGQFSVATMVKTGATTWLLFGDLS